jgi:hypothetical protein
MKHRAACVVFVLMSLAQLTFAQSATETTSAANDAAPQSNVAPTLSGGGTKDYVPLWLSPTKLGNSKLFQTGGKIGIGTTTPTATLDVNGAINAATSYHLGSRPFAFGSYTNANAMLGFAGNSTMTGAGNTATGAGAMYSNTTGSFNTANGEEVLYYNTTGTFNTAIGGFALGVNSTGQDNTAVGGFALTDNSTGNDNTAVGNGALQNNNTGGNNTAVGSAAGFNVTTGSNNIDIGNLGVASDNGAIRIGTAGSQTSAFIAGIYDMSTSVNNAVPVLIDSNGNLGTISSSRRYKEDIQDMGEASSGLMRLRPVTFRYKKPFDDGSQPMQYGLIAEEVAEVYPDLVARSVDGQIESVKYQLLDPMLLNELQRQQAEIRDQQNDIRDLQERLSKMEAALVAVSHASESR